MRGDDTQTCTCTLLACDHVRPRPTRSVHRTRCEGRTDAAQRMPASCRSSSVLSRKWARCGQHRFDFHGCLHHQPGSLQQAESMPTFTVCLLS